MDTATFNRRVLERNPLYPYAWEVRYNGGGRLRQFDFDRQHFSREIDIARVESLVILGHPSSPIVLELPYADRPPDEVIIKAQVSIHETICLGAPGKEMSREVKVFFGFRYGPEKFLVEIDEAGRIWKTNKD